jgi:limonene-1,2-epoxide hydrolase
MVTTKFAGGTPSSSFRHACSNFEEVRIETLNQASKGSVVIAEQIHHLAWPDGSPSLSAIWPPMNCTTVFSGKLTPILNTAIYEIADGKIAAWRDYTDSLHAKKLLGL